MKLPLLVIGLLLLATTFIGCLQLLAMFMERRHAAMFSGDLSDEQKERIRRNMQRALDHRRYFVIHVLVWASLTLLVALIAIRFVALPFGGLMAAIVLHGIPVSLYFTRWNPDSLLRKSTRIMADFEGQYPLKSNVRYMVGDDGELIEVQ